MSAISTISYCKYFNSQKDVHTVSHDDLDSNSVDIKYFIEILKNPEVIRPYFDFDEHDINNKQDWDEFIAELDRLSNSLGPYCIACIVLSMPTKICVCIDFMKDCLAL